MDKDLDSNYTEKCSLQTIQSDEKGFFSELYENIKNECSTKWLNNIFAMLKSDKEKLTILYNEPNVCDILLGTLEHVSPVFKQKNAQISMEKRLCGEKFYTNKEYDKALMLLSQAVLRAPSKGENLRIDGGLSLAFALWSRSAVLLAIKNGKLALCDLQYALTNGLPAKQHGEYYGRLAKAYALIGENAKIPICLNLAERFIQDQVALEQLKSDVAIIECNEMDGKIEDEPELTMGENVNVKNASNLLAVAKTHENGNYIIANDDISTGDTLLMEKPIISCLLPKFFGSHCLHCFQRLTAPIGCPNCSGIAFCSIECMNIGCSTYHKFECKFMDLMIGSGMSILCFMALRFITECGEPLKAIEMGKNIIKNLCGHSNLRKPNDYLQRSIMSTLLLRILQKADFFGYRKSESAYPENIELEIAEILLGLLQVLQFNAHEIFETQLGENHKFTGSKHIYIAVGLYETGALFNHNCYPSVTRYFIGKTIVLCALHPIKNGDYVGENYGPIYTKQNLLQRQRNLRSRYWFQCKCISCRENWQLLEKLNNKARLRCPTPLCTAKHNYPENPKKTINCKKCRKTIALIESVRTLLKCEEIYRKGAEYMEKENTDDAIKTLIEGINLFYTIAEPPHEDTQIAEESLRACYANKGTTSKTTTTSTKPTSTITP